VTELVAVRPVDQGDRLAALVAAFVAGRRSKHTARAYGRDVTAWCTWCQSHGLDPLRLRAAHVTLWLADLAAAGEADATRARRLAAVSSWYAWLARQDVVETNPVDRVDPGERPRVSRTTSPTAVLSAGQAAELLTLAEADRNPRSYAIVAVLLYCALRVDEMCSADLDALRLSSGHPVLSIMGKGRRERTVPVPAPARGCR
jgi:integrase/recombinase XerD